MSLNELQSMAALASDAVSEPRFRTILLGTFAGLAIALASIGVFGVLSYFVTQRTREIGIRVALGAGSGDILRMIIGRGLALSGLGLALGLAAAIPLTRSMQTLLCEVKPLDAATLAFVVIGLALVAGLASYPARPACPAHRADDGAASGVKFTVYSCGLRPPFAVHCLPFTVDVTAADVDVAP
jgi:predicted lysophospholipase L1 biosynthesis ABC-type transport system permease subunit